MDHLFPPAFEWYDPAPPGYPWPTLSLPPVANDQEAKTWADQIKAAGNDRLKQGDYYDAIWKYSHALQLCLERPGLSKEAAVIQGNCALACLKLGDSLRPLVPPPQLNFWYAAAFSHANASIFLDPGSDIVYKAFFRRAEATRKLIAMFPSGIIPGWLIPFDQAAAEAIRDYIQSHRIYENVQALCEAIILAVDYGQTYLIPTLQNSQVLSGFSTKLLQELVLHHDTQQCHLQFVIQDMPSLVCMLESAAKPFDASCIQLSAVLKKPIRYLPLLERMFELGMTVRKEDIKVAFEVLPDDRVDILELVLSKFKFESTSFEAVRKAAVESNKNQLLACLNKHMPKDPKELVAQIKEEGNQCFKSGSYGDALGKYFQALKLCREHSLKTEGARIRSNCAQACMKMEMYDDAYTHCTECIQLDPTFDKGYFRRAEALKKSLISHGNMPFGSFRRVVSDYCQCHKLKQNLDALCEAIILGVDHQCADLIPKFKTEQIGDFSTELLQKLVSKSETKQDHLKFLIYEMPPVSSKQPFNASTIELVKILKLPVTDARLLSILFELGVSIKPKDILVAVKTLSESHSNLLHLILSSCKCSKAEMNVNALCKVAMEAGKMEFVALFIKYWGVTPPPEELKQCSGWPQKEVNPIIKRYLTFANDPASRVAGVPHPVVKGTALDPSVTEYDENVLAQLNAEAKRCFENKDYDGALHYYGIALYSCDRMEGAVIRGNIAHVFLAMQSYQYAYINANICVQLNPFSAKGLFRRAEALRKALQSPQWRPGVPPNLGFGDVINDYCACHALKPDVKSLCEAIIVAVDHDCCQLLPLFTDSELKSGFCVKLLQKLLLKQKTKERHISFVIFHMCPKKQAFDASEIELAALLKVPVTDKKLLEKLFEFRIKVTSDNIQTAVSLLPVSSVDILMLIITKCMTGVTPEILNRSCQKAYSARKLPFVLCLIEHGAESPAEPTDLILLALKLNNFDMVLNLLLNHKIDSEKVDLGDLITKSDHIGDPSIIAKLLEAGVSPNGCGKKKPIAEILKLQYISSKKQIDLLCLLLEKGDCHHLCLGGKERVTPLHIATELALKADGDTRIIDAVVSAETFDSTGKIVDEKSQTPFHVAVKSHWKREVSMVVLSALIQTNTIDPWQKDCSGKRAIDFLKKNDDRWSLLDQAMQQTRSVPLDSEKKGKKKSKKKAQASKQPRNKPNKTPLENREVPCSESIVIDQQQKKVEKTVKVVDQQKEVKKTPKVVDYGRLTSNEKLEWQMKRVLSKNAEYFARSTPPDDDQPQEACNKAPDATKLKQEGEPVPQGQQSHDFTSAIQPEQSPPLTADFREQDELPEGEDMTNILSSYGLSFDELPWEVEITNKVIKFFKDSKNNPPLLRFRAAQTIFQLAEGRRGSALSKQVGSEPRLHLYEARMTRGGRILWEKAIQFSSRRSGQSGTQVVYAQVIRVWDIVRDHDNLDRSIRRCVEQIESSHRRGNYASVHLSLQKQPQPLKAIEPVKGREVLEIPLTFLVSDPEFKQPQMYGTETDTPQFTPAASMKEDEYNVTTFYSFDTAVVKSMLTGTNVRRDFPFKEWPKEHEIINLRSNEAILLLGRSGTGKTTCCLYRLWNEFKNYWDPANAFAETKLPRKRFIHPRMLLPPVETNPDAAETDETDTNTKEQGSSDSESYDTAEEDQSMEECSTFADPEVVQPKQQELGKDDQQTCEPNIARGAHPHLSEDCFTTEVEVLDHLHQVFITKNYVLCDQMKKRFYDMVAAHEFLAEHMEFENAELPNSLDAVKDNAYPLFITARQFYILLDNSLHDGKPYFDRDENGNLAVKVSSSDYDHEDFDTLLDLEESDDEGTEESKAMAEHIVPTLQQPAVKQKRTEVTSLYFKEKIWPVVSHKCDGKGFDPLLVWMEIQSFIKGSEKALRKGSPLLQDEYKTFGNRFAPNFADHRDKMYNMFECYEKYCQNQRHSRCGILFDECDLIQNLHKRLSDVRDVPWTIHSLYVDEVQDFTQAELALLIHCCRDPNSIFFTGDTAQSIMRGISFRFQDLRSSFYRINKSVAEVKVPQKPHTLTINFRSHVGILQLARSIIDLLGTFFKGSIDDHLPEDTGMFPGPVPVLLESCEDSDLALLLSTNKREASAIEFGAHQVILVQSKEAKEELPTMLRGAIVLTIFEAKGLEFDDVLLYNFFKDSLVSDKVWRVVTSYLEMKEHSKCIVNQSKLPGSKIEPRSKAFEEKEHKSLCADLKYLYTAVTRAKCNLWIYDSDKTKRLPMFDYWHKRGLVKVVSTTEGGESKHNVIFASISTTEQWKVQGDYFSRKHLWEQAQHCYEKSGPENAHLAKQANAYLLIQRARAQLNPTLFRDAAICLLECDQLRHDIKCLSSAAVCLKKTKPPRYVDAAKLLEKLGDIHHAFFAYKKGKDLDSCVRLLEQTHEYNRALKVLSENSKRRALAKAAEYENWGIILDEEFTTKELSYWCASLYAKRKDKDLLLEVLQYMSETERRIRFMKEAQLFEEAFDEHVKEKQYKAAYRLASAQGWYHKAILLAKQQKDSKTVASFTLQKAITDYYRQTQESKLKQIQANSELMHELHSVTKSEDDYTKAQAYLLLGIFKEDVSFCKRARVTFKSLRHKVGEVEAFRAIAHLDVTRNESIRSVLDACHSAREAGNSLMNASNLSQVVQHAAEFYNLQEIRDVYHMPKGQDVWICKLDKCICKERSQDLDGMLRLYVSSARDLMAKHVRSFVERWLQDFQLSQKLVFKLNSFSLHKEIREKRFLSRQYSIAEISAVALQEYLQTCIYLLELSLLSHRWDTGEVQTLIFSVFSPQVSIYLPLSKKHVTIVRNSKVANEDFHRWIKSTIPEQTEHKDKIRFDPWLAAWRACCITVGEPTVLSSIIDKQTEGVNAEYEKFKKQSVETINVSESEKTDSQSTAAKPQRGKAEKRSVSEQSQVDQDLPAEFQVPEPFFLWKNEDRYYHVFYYWLKSCRLIREEGKALWASKCAIYHFLGNIARSKSVFISVMNMVDILSVHCTAVMMMLTHLNAFQKHAPFNFIIPLLYQHAIQVFDDLNTCRKGHKWVSKACTEEVEQAIRRRNGLLYLRKDCMKLLWCSLDLLLGKYSSRFNVLKFSLNTAAATHCLILTLSIFGNLVLTRSKPNQEIEIYQRKISGILQKAAKSEYHPKYIDDSFQSSVSPNFPHTVFTLVDRLLLLGSPNTHATLARIQFIPRTGKVTFVAIPSQQAQQLPSSQQPSVGQQQAQQLPISQQPTHQPTISYASSVTVPEPPHGTTQKVRTPRLPPPPLDYSPSNSSLSYAQSLSASQQPEVHPQSQIPIQQPRPPPGFISPGPVAALAGISPTSHPIYKQFPLAPQLRFATPSSPPQQSTFSYSGGDSTMPETHPPHAEEQYFKPFSNSGQVVATPGIQPSQVEEQYLQQPAHATFSHPTGAIHVGGLPSPYHSGSEYLAEPGEHNLQTTESYPVESNLHVSSPLHNVEEQLQTVETEREQQEAEGVIDYETDEVLSQAFVGQDHRKEDVKHQIDPELIDPTLFEDNVCNVCSVILRVEPTYDTEDEDELEGIPNVESDVHTESYWLHVHSEAHQTNVKLYKKFRSDHELYYSPLMDDLNKIRDQCQSLHVPSLARTIDDITVEIERNELRMADIGRNWAQGIREISEMGDRVHALLNRANQEYERVVLTALKANVSDVHGEQDEEAYIQDLEREIDSDMELDDHLASGTDISVTARTEEEKQRARDRKRGRRIHRGGGK